MASMVSRFEHSAITSVPNCGSENPIILTQNTSLKGKLEIISRFEYCGRLT